jgi:hypothetical protein
MALFWYKVQMFYLWQTKKIDKIGSLSKSIFPVIRVTKFGIIRYRIDTARKNVPKDTSAIDLETTISRTILCIMPMASRFEILGYVLNSWFISWILQLKLL